MKFGLQGISFGVFAVNTNTVFLLHQFSKEDLLFLVFLIDKVSFYLFKKSYLMQIIVKWIWTLGDIVC